MSAHSDNRLAINRVPQAPQPDTARVPAPNVTSALVRSKPGPGAIQVSRPDGFDPLSTLGTTVGRPGPVGDSVIDEAALMSSPTTIPATKHAACGADRSARKDEALTIHDDCPACSPERKSNVHARVQWLTQAR
jgi:hypothetical protein